MTFPGWAGTQVLASSWGLAQPSYTAKVGAVVQNLAPAVVTSSIIRDWINVSGSTTWQDQKVAV